MTFSRFQRFVLWIVAVASLLTAIFLLLQAGLPDRRDFIGFAIDDGVYVAPAVGEMAPPIEAVDINGMSVRLDDFRGESVIINFWATWCVPCQIEMPDLQMLHDDRGILILGVNIGESQALIRDWVAEFGLSFVIIPDSNQAIYRDYRVIGQPATFVVNGGGIITHIFFGPVSSEALETALDNHQANG